MADLGVISFRFEQRFYTLYLEGRGWLAVEMLHFLDDILEAQQPATQIVKTLGYTIQISEEKPSRQGRHWVVIHLEDKLIETNSPILAAIVDEKPLPPDSPLQEATYRRIYSVLDENDFTVKIYR